MPRNLKIAALQMDVKPAPTLQRLGRAAGLVAQAAAQGAQLIVLPELFATGYAYTEQNFYRAETLNGLTVSWMQEIAARHGVHLAGSLLLLDQGQIYNALLLIAPDGRAWRYDKRYPWGWERGYFRPGRGVTVAHTALGDIGLLICWDVAHANLWQQYGGQVDLMLICSCPPDIANSTYHLPDGRQVAGDELGPVLAAATDAGRRVFDDTIRQQSAWLGVPAVNTVGCGRFISPVPQGRASLLGILPAAPWLARYLPQADRMQLSCAMTPGCRILDARGQTLAECAQEQGESFALAQVSLADHKSQPGVPQPRPPVPLITYLVSDLLLPGIMLPVYQRGLRRAWGAPLPPAPAARRRQMRLLALLLLASALTALFLRRRNRLPD